MSRPRVYQNHLRKSLRCYLDELYDPSTSADERNTLKDLKPLIMFLIKNELNFPYDFFNLFKSFKVDLKEIKQILTNFDPIIKKSIRNVYNPSDRTITHGTSNVINIVLTYWYFKAGQYLVDFIRIYYYCHIQSFPNLNINEFLQKLYEFPRQPASEPSSPSRDSTISAQKEETSLSIVDPKDDDLDFSIFEEQESDPNNDDFFFIQNDGG